ncbi:hypothetical protein ACKF11_13575 [Methylobacillus sp. Pita2]|uniref:hypothetical protein n=1 Tax=Methylobacillus sp. Pita2 TaxID=3383245 RepID=UPI0038B61EB8
MDSLTQWLMDLKYLPKAFRDFHAQKALFKTIDLRVNADHLAPLGANLPQPVAQIFIIDVFLHFMAKRGYVLKKITHKAIAFRSLANDINETMTLESQRQAAVLTGGHVEASKPDPAELAGGHALRSLDLILEKARGTQSLEEAHQLIAQAQGLIGQQMEAKKS